MHPENSEGALERLELSFSAVCDAARLERATYAAFQWLARNLPSFNPFVAPKPSGPSKGPNIIRSKALLELSCISMYYKRAIPEGIVLASNSLVETCLEYATEIWARPDFQDLAVRQPSLFRLYATIYVALRQCNIAEDAFAQVIQGVYDQGYVTAIEDIPFRVLELRYILDLGGFSHDLPTYRELFEPTLLAKVPSLAYLTDEDAYSVTHTIFYLTDFGHQSIKDVLTDHEYARACSTVTQLLGHYVRRRHWDLVAELLMSCTCLRWFPSPIGPLAWNFLLEAQMPDVSVPGPFSPEKSEMYTEDKRQQRYFEQNYHTTLV